MEVLIREFRPGDLDGLFVLDYRNYAPPYRFGYQQLLHTLADRNVMAMVIEGARNGDVIGALIVRGEPANRQAAIISLTVDEAYRRQGLGSRLLARAETFARASGWDALVVPVERGNAQAAAFLRASRFEDTRVSQPYFARPEEGSLWKLTLTGSAEE